MPVFKFRNLKTGQAMPVPEGEFLVGRTDNAYVHVDDPSVSRNHARLLNNAEGFFVEDLGSANGTALRGAFLTTRAKLEFGNVVHIGSVAFRIDPEVQGEVEAQPPPSSRNVSLASMTRHTERIPLPELPESNPSSKTAAIEGSPFPGVTIDPKSDVPPAPRQSQPLVASPAGVLPVQAASTRGSSAPQQQARQQALLESEKRESSRRDSAPSSSQTNFNPGKAEAPEKDSGWIWYLVTFFAGLGAGLLLGLIFAKLFLDMGGKLSGLP